MAPKPVLLLGFNRPDHFREVSSAVLANGERRVYIALDGPRPNDERERAACKQVTQIATEIAQDCDTSLLLRKQNLGLKPAVAGALDWFFANEESGIVLEDDCLPTADFFLYMDEYLEQFLGDPKVMSISGTNLLGTRLSVGSGPFLSILPEVWGWGSWRRAWSLVDLEMQHLYTFLKSGWLEATIREPRARAYMVTKLLDQRFGSSSWGIPWLYSHWLHDRLTVLPSQNLVSNIGFGAQATHGTDEMHPLRRLPVGTFRFRDLPLPQLPDDLQDELLDRAVDADHSYAHYWIARARLLYRTLSGRR